MKILTKLEEFAQVLLSIYLFSLLPYAWWVFPLFFFAPDLSLVGLLAGKRVGALTYNLIHHKALALGIYILGSLFSVPLLSLIGILLLGHSSFDRVLSLGLLEIDSHNDISIKSIPQKA
jgi:Domain of unknown function (DUF4260)